MLKVKADYNESSIQIVKKAFRRFYNSGIGKSNFCVTILPKNGNASRCDDYPLISLIVTCPKNHPANNTYTNIQALRRSHK